MILRQKDGSELRTFTISDSGLKIREENEFGEFEKIVPFEVISNDFINLKFNPIHWIVFFVIIILFIISIFFIYLFGIEGDGKLFRYLLPFLAGGLAVLYFEKGKSTILSCYGEDGIEFYKDKPNKATFDDFISNLLKKRNEVLKEKYGFVSEFIAYDVQLEKFNLLHQLSVINLEELKSLKIELKELAENNDFKFNMN